MLFMPFLIRVIQSSTSARGGQEASQCQESLSRTVGHQEGGISPLAVSEDRCQSMGGPNMT